MKFAGRGVYLTIEISSAGKKIERLDRGGGGGRSRTYQVYSSSIL